ncbi:Winged helix-like DNA-binding domain superfamily [Sesbania bispinosa]|nr:Winged helix-like DNA-binding domain superfamily [Sesbania bispinosa]
MATQSPSPPIPTGQNTGAEIVQPTNVDQHNSGEGLVKQSSSTSVFVNSEPMREEQVQNAVKFLSHPKVRGSPVIYRRSFLEKKGLTKEEIDEAFRRVPDSPSSVQTTGVNQDGQLKPSSDIQQQGQPQALQPVVSTSGGVTTSMGTLTRQNFRWSHALVTVGLLVVSGAGTAMLIKVFATKLFGWCYLNCCCFIWFYAFAEKRYFVEVVSLLDKQVQEMKLMTNSIRRLEASTGRSISKQEDPYVTQTSSKIQQLVVNGKADYQLPSVRSSSPPASVEPSSAPHPKSYMEIMAMIQRGEKPSNIRDIDDSPPNPYQQPSNPRLAPRAKVQSTSTQVLHSQVNGKEQDNGDNPVPWWQTKNVRIKEIDNEIEYNGAPAAFNQKPAQRMWVPPQPPPVVMPEAAEAIRRPKPVVQKELMPDDQSVAQSSDISDGVEGISKQFKSEGTIEGSKINPLLSSSETQDHEVNNEEQ